MRIALVLFSLLVDSVTVLNSIDIQMNAVGGVACPYTASWLAATDLYMKTHFSTTTLKMEEASFSLMLKSTHVFQLSNPNLYYVNHMSAYEHIIMHKYGFDVAENRTMTMSQAAIFAECSGILAISPTNFLSLIPFYGGRPPDVDQYLKVQSIGQGNSLVGASTKALQCIAAACSVLRHMGGSVVLGVSNDHDRNILQNTIRKYNPHIMSHVVIQKFKIPKPASLPFYLLGWGQIQVHKVNCALGDMKTSNEANCDKLHGVVVVDVPTPSLLLSTKRRITHVYYTESDQIVNFHSAEVLYALANASNGDTIFMGSRQEKSASTTADRYGHGLSATRPGCGQSGYVLNWPKSREVRRVNKSDVRPIPEVHQKQIVPDLVGSGKTPLQKRIVQRTKIRTSNSIAGQQMQSTFERIKVAAG